MFSGTSWDRWQDNETIYEVKPLESLTAARGPLPELSKLWGNLCVEAPTEPSLDLRCSLPPVALYKKGINKPRNLLRYQLVLPRWSNPPLKAPPQLHQQPREVKVENHHKHQMMREKRRELSNDWPVQLLPFSLVTWAPCLRRTRTDSRWPRETAKCRGVRPLGSTVSMSFFKKRGTIYFCWNFAAKEDV